VGDDNGRPGRGGRSKAAENHSTPIVADQVRAAILAALDQGDTLSLPELAARLEGHGLEVDGDQSLVLGQDPNVVVWTRWCPDVIDVLVELVAEGRLVVEVCSAERYRGLQVDLPVAPVRRPPGRLLSAHWLPCVVWSPRCYRLSDAGAA
jgi:hypothetical protein